MRVMRSFVRTNGTFFPKVVSHSERRSLIWSDPIRLISASNATASNDFRPKRLPCDIASPFGDTVTALAINLLRGNREAKPLLDSAGNHAPHAVRLPSDPLGDIFNAGALGLSQHSENRRKFGVTTFGRGPLPLCFVFGHPFHGAAWGGRRGILSAAAIASTDFLGLEHSFPPWLATA